MKASSRSLLLACVVVAALFGGGTQAQEPAWQSFSPRGGGFTVSLPGTPEASNYKDNDDQAFRWVVALRAYALAAGYVTYAKGAPKDPKSWLEQTRDLTVKASKGKLLEDKEIRLAGNPGREFRFENGDGRICSVRLYLVKDRLYQTLAIAKDEAAVKADLVRFLNSFQLRETR
jgi:hypothetical protein